MVELISKIISNVLTALYQPFWFFSAISCFVPLLLPICKGSWMERSHTPLDSFFQNIYSVSQTVLSCLFCYDDSDANTFKPKYVGKSSVECSRWF